MGKKRQFFSKRKAQFLQIARIQSWSVENEMLITYTYIIFSSHTKSFHARRLQTNERNSAIALTWIDYKMNRNFFMKQTKVPWWKESWWKQIATSWQDWWWCTLFLRRRLAQSSSKKFKMAWFQHASPRSMLNLHLRSRILFTEKNVCWSFWTIIWFKP